MASHPPPGWHGLAHTAAGGQEQPEGKAQHASTSQVSLMFATVHGQVQTQCGGTLPRGVKVGNELSLLVPSGDYRKGSNTY